MNSFCNHQHVLVIVVRWSDDVLHLRGLRRDSAVSVHVWSSHTDPPETQKTASVTLWSSRDQKRAEHPIIVPLRRSSGWWTQSGLIIHRRQESWERAVNHRHRFISQSPSSSSSSLQWHSDLSFRGVSASDDGDDEECPVWRCRLMIRRESLQVYN